VPQGSVPIEIDAFLTVVQERGRLVEVETPTIDTLARLGAGCGGLVSSARALDASGRKPEQQHGLDRACALPWRIVDKRKPHRPHPRRSPCAKAVVFHMGEVDHAARCCERSRER